MEYNPPSRIKPILELCRPKNAHTHEWQPTAFYIKVSLSMRITESILAVILYHPSMRINFFHWCSKCYNFSEIWLTNWDKSKLLHLFCVQINKKKKKKKRSTYWPSKFSAQKDKQTFYFLGLIINLTPSHQEVGTVIISNLRGYWPMCTIYQHFYKDGVHTLCVYPHTQKPIWIDNTQITRK